ncbi:trypsin-like serine peptidase [Gloeobacter morelensis]|uniref:Serine protease n=1 Tax=Gloeobacter morelensis MG652769 TaxID=2781736 RepID=A0ABY3PKH5_9CYAN|nr:serine protease [Gloeobacter morelensis]UFP94138.1 serine protease [Gloeobacter morelensis MG652769]
MIHITSMRGFCASLCVSLLTMGAVAHAQPPVADLAGGPLPVDHPAAQADPAFMGLPDLVPPPYDSNSPRLPESLALREVGYNPLTGEVRTGAPVKLPVGNLSSFTPAYAGPDGDNADPGADSVIGTDNRVQITSTTTFPYRAVTKLNVQFPYGAGGCSGILIAAKYVLTAGHCIYSPSSGGWATSVQVIPGQSGSYQPYGAYSATYIRTFSSWTSYSDPNYDMALITLNSSVGNTTGWMGYGYDSTIVGTTGNIAGYPGDKGGSTMWYDNDPVISASTYRVTYNIDTYGGQSGSGVYQSSGSTLTVFATHTNGGSSNSGTRIDSSKNSTLGSWISSGY